MQYLFPDFLSDHHEYAKTEAYWLHEVWERIPESYRRFGGWRPAWFTAGPPHDGNPIFTAVSVSLRKGVRVIQYEPLMTGVSLELDFWLDTVGGPATDPRTFQELVIACSLSMESAALAHKFISAWLTGSIEMMTSSNDREGFVTVSNHGRLRRTELVSLRQPRPFAPAA
ncbi:MAG: hypothetical protein ACREHD_00520 [Pirellulales bacterium]